MSQDVDGTSTVAPRVIEHEKPSEVMRRFWPSATFVIAHDPWVSPDWQTSSSPPIGSTERLVRV